MTRCLLITLLLSGCAAPGAKREITPAAAARPDSVSERYWLEQRAQRPIPPPDCEWLELRRPESTADGIIRHETVEYLRIPRSP